MTPKEIGMRISATREDVGITRKELAERIQVAASTITRYEKGTISKIKIPVIGAIARALNVNPLWIIGESEYKSSNAMRIKAIDLNEHEEELIKKYRLLSPAGKKEVDHYLDFRLSAEAPRVEKDAEISSS